MASIYQPVREAYSDRLFCRLARTHPVLVFLALAYLIGWVMVVPRILFSLGSIGFNVPNGWIAASFYAPCVAAALVQWFAQRNLQMCRIYESFGKLACGIVLGAFLILVGNVVVAGIAAAKDPRTLTWSVFLSRSSYNFQYSALIPTIGEEIGWRGFALPRLQERFGPVLASVLVGLMWAGFMLPAFTLIQLWSLRQITMYAIAMVALSVEITFAVNISGLSVIVAIVMHFLAQAELLDRSIVAHSQLRSNWEWIVCFSNLLIPLVLVWITRGRLGLQASGPEFAVNSD